MLEGATAWNEHKYIKKKHLSDQTIQKQRDIAMRKKFKDVNTVKGISIFSKDRCG